MKTKILEKFKALYGDGAVCYASPGRVNLIGEHTDYNMGFVMPGVRGSFGGRKHIYKFRHRQGDLCGG